MANAAAQLPRRDATFGERGRTIPVRRSRFCSECAGYACFASSGPCAGSPSFIQQP